MRDLKQTLDAYSDWRGRRLILHAGANKTGTTSLQFAFAQSRVELRSKGILYPTEGTINTHVPKHQWLIDHLHFGKDEMRFAERIANCLDEGNQFIHTVILSTEGIFNHWWDLRSEAKEHLRSLSAFFDLEVFLWLRQPIDYYRSFYLQNLKNPRVPFIEAYGHDLSAIEMLSIPWVAEHLRYSSIVEDMTNVFGIEKVFPFAYKTNSIVDFFNLLDMEDPCIPERKNTSILSGLGVELLRVVNRADLDAERKRVAYTALQKLDEVFGADQYSLDPNAEALVNSLCPQTDAELARLDAYSKERWRKTVKT